MLSARSPLAILPLDELGGPGHVDARQRTRMHADAYSGQKLPLLDFLTFREPTKHCKQEEASLTLQGHCLDGYYSHGG